MCQCYFDRICVAIILTTTFSIYSVSSSRSKEPEVDGIGKYPFMVVIYQIRYVNVVKLCGGTLIQPQWVLASHSCKVDDSGANKTKKGTDIVVASVYNLELVMKGAIRPLKVWMKHPEYGRNKYSITNDIALINLDSSYIINLNIHPIMLASQSALNNTELDDRFNHCTFIFWKISVAKEELQMRKPWLVHESKNSTLQQLEVKFVPKEKCQNAYVKGNIITHGQVCVKVAGKGQFPLEHSGGPLICQDVQVGIFTWQKVVKQNTVVAIFTRIDSFEKYITGIVSNLVLADKRYFRNISNPMLQFRGHGRLKQHGSMYYSDAILLISVVVLSVISNF